MQPNAFAPLRANKIVLIDDDKFFGNSMVEMAKDYGLDLDYFESLADLGFVSGLGRYKAAVVDYHLDRMTGIEIARYIDSLFGNIPTLLISSDATAETQQMPACISRFINKNNGLYCIINALREVAT